MSPEDHSRNFAAGSEPATPTGVRAFAVLASTVVFFIIWMSVATCLSLVLGAGTDVNQLWYRPFSWCGGNFIGGAGAFVAAYALAKLLAPDVSMKRLDGVIGWALGIGLMLAIVCAIAAFHRGSNIVFFTVALAFMFVFCIGGTQSAASWLKANGFEAGRQP